MLTLALCALTSGLLGADPAFIPERERNGLPHLRSESVAVRFADTSEVVLEKNPNVVRPIASVTKLMSGLVLDDANKDGDALVTIADDDRDKVKWSKSRLVVGLSAPWRTLFSAALGASENRAMYASVRAAGFLRSAFVDKMNETARALGMTKSTFKDPAGIDPGNQSTAHDLLLLLDNAAKHEAICDATLGKTFEVGDEDGPHVELTNPNRLARSSHWDLVVGKTGYTVEAGRALVVRARIGERPVDMVFLGAREMASVFGDAARMRRWLEEKFSLHAAVR